MSLEVSWGKLNADDSNGKITQYDVCYQRGLVVVNCAQRKTVPSVSNTTTTLRDLSPATNYTVAVRAYTRIGAGKFGNPYTVTTNESGEFRKNL